MSDVSHILWCLFRPIPSSQSQRWNPSPRLSCKNKSSRSEVRPRVANDRESPKRHDHPVIRRVVRSTLQSQLRFDVCGEATDGAQAIKEAKKLKPDVVVQPEMERGRSPLVSNPPFGRGIFKASIRPPGYPALRGPCATRACLSDKSFQEN
jgi:hypothetical protein